MEQTCPHDGVHMPESSFAKMMSEMSEDQRVLFEDLAWTKNADVEIKNMGKINTASLELDGNVEHIERVLVGRGLDGLEQRPQHRLADERHRAHGRHTRW